jgi:hypothetical protein
VVYYQGEELINERGHFFLTDQCQDYPADRKWEVAITCERLASFLATTPGAQIFFLDVSRPASLAEKSKDNVVRRTEQDAPEVIFRTVWQGSSNVPDDARLLGALESAIRQASRLGDVEKVLMTAFSEIAKKYQQSEPFRAYLPVEAKNWTVGKP